ncbi:FG-GAP-like repeat-containing protein [Runella zeae]|uniref:FG-GAP-like repeat-containing protein n=1 Tax=Runella zeae TaxID=94255 RepID=UPI002356D271|nr:FG-GAP-like repeat-containing protein [Runella zeae]
MMQIILTKIGDLKKLLFVGIVHCCIMGLRVEVVAQSFSFRWDASVKVKVGGKELINPWAGGQNSAQFSKMHLDNDGIEDLVIFDRSNHHVATFLAIKQGDKVQWRYTPQYEAKFPSMLHWMLLLDYDQDGRKDLFTSTTAGIRVFKNIATSNGFDWQLIADPLLTQGFSGNINLYVPSTDLPAIVDIDDDGDIDILTFDFTGASVELHQNLSKEQKSTQPFVFRKVTTNWGRFAATSNCNEYIFNLEPADAPLQEITQTNVFSLSEILAPTSNAKLNHAGNTLWVGDVDGDGRKDFLHGHIACDNVAKLKNVGGNGMAALFGSVEANFPAQKPINFPLFPSAYVEDLDGDGVRDLVVSPSSTDLASNVLINLRESNWFYRNEVTNLQPRFTYQQSDFLQSEMIDLGENAAPLLADVDGDGDLDLLVGYGGTRMPNGYRGGIYFYRNVGSIAQATFEFVTDDYLNLSSRLATSENVFLVNTKPFIADLNGDGTLDLGFWANTFKGMDIRFLPNNAPRGRAMQLDTTRLSKLPNPNNFANGENLLYYDIDQDGKLDVLIAKNTGNVEYHRNTGTTLAPQYQRQTEAFGGLDVDFDKRSQGMVVADLNGDRKPELIMGDLLGQLRVYKNFTEPNVTLKSDSNLIFNVFTNQTEFLKIGVGLFPAAGDLDGDGLPELLIGSNTGGIKFLKNTSTKVVIPGEPLTFIAYPNPTSLFLYAQIPTDGQIDLYSLTGQLVAHQSALKAGVEAAFDVTKLAMGVYIVRFVSREGEVATQKIVISR